MRCADRSCAPFTSRATVLSTLKACVGESLASNPVVTSCPFAICASCFATAASIFSCEGSGALNPVTNRATPTCSAKWKFSTPLNTPPGRT